MAKIKYRFNPETLSYDKISLGLKKRLLRLLPHILSSIVLTLILYFVVFYNFIDSPKEKKLKREVTVLKTQFDILNSKFRNAYKVLSELQYRDDNIYRTLFEAEPIPSTVREAGVGGVNRYSKLESFANSEIVISTTKKLDKLLRKIVIQSKSFDKIEELATNKEKFLTSVPAVQPIRTKELTRIASYFGWRDDPVYRGVRKMHEGIDFTAPRGTEIFVTGDGVIEQVKYSRRGYGNQIIVNHGFGYKTRYAHLYKILVRPGQKVTRGDIIGQVGSTGKSIGPHLHYEVLKNNKAINPINFFYLDLSPEEYDKMLELSSIEGGKSLD